jgi:hypothetical protein
MRGVSMREELSTISLVGDSSEVIRQLQRRVRTELNWRTAWYKSVHDPLRESAEERKELAPPKFDGSTAPQGYYPHGYLPPRQR